MSVTTASCGRAGWVSDVDGYRYSSRDPETQQPWPPIPPLLLDVAQRAAAMGGFDGFVSDSCLINCYVPGARMSLHQDKNERNFSAPIVSLSLGLPIVFLFGGMRRSDRPLRYRLQHGDAVVWGGPARLAFHGVEPLADGHHPLLGRRRINLTFRKAL
jgi:alkylated DNA repair protein (DNA oxidative demethylase)